MHATPPPEHRLAQRQLLLDNPPRPSPPLRPRPQEVLRELCLLSAVEIARHPLPRWLMLLALLLLALAATR